METARFSQALFQALGDRNTATINTLIPTLTQEELNAKNRAGQTPLHASARLGNEGAVSLLLEMKVDVDSVETGTGATALHISSHYGYTNILSLLLSFGCNTEIKNKEGQTAKEQHDPSVSKIWEIFSSSGTAGLVNEGFKVFRPSTKNPKRMVKSVSNNELSKKKIRPHEPINIPSSSKKPTSLDRKSKEDRTVDTTSPVNNGNQVKTRNRSHSTGESDADQTIQNHKQEIDPKERLRFTSVGIPNKNPIETNSTEENNHLKVEESYVAERPLDYLEIPKMLISSELYITDYSTKEHYNFIGSRNDTCEFVVSVMKNPEPTTNEHDINQYLNLGISYRTLVTSAEESRELMIPATALPIKKGSSIARGILDLLNHTDGVQMYDVPPEFNEDFKKWVENNSKGVKILTAALIYVKNNQNKLYDILQNRPPQDSSFWNFLNDSAKKGKLKDLQHYRNEQIDIEEGYYTIFNDTEIIYYAAPFLTSQHSKLILSQTCVIVFYDSDEPFNISILKELEAAKVVIVVRPDESNYDLEFYHRKDFPSFKPHLPSENLDFPSFYEFMLTKLYNGYVTALNNNPTYLNNRAISLQALGAKYPREKRGKRIHKLYDSSPLRKSGGKSKGSMIRTQARLETPAEIAPEIPKSHVFQIHLGSDQKKSIVYDSNKSKKIKDILNQLCSARKIKLDEYEVRDMNGSLLELEKNTTLESLKVMEIKLVKASKNFTIYLNNWTKKSVIYNPNDKLNKILLSICTSRDLNRNNFQVTDMAGNILKIDDNTTLEELKNLEVRFVEKEKKTGFVTPEKKNKVSFEPEVTNPKTVEDVCNWVSSIEKVPSEFLQKLAAEKIDGNVLLNLTQEDFMKWGLSSSQSSQLFHAITNMRSDQSFATPSKPDLKKSNRKPHSPRIPSSSSFPLIPEIDSTQDKKGTSNVNLPALSMASPGFARKSLPSVPTYHIHNLFKNQSKFAPEIPNKTLEEPVLNILENLYTTEFLPHNHINFIGSEGTEHVIVSVKQTPSYKIKQISCELYKALIFDKKGANIFYLNTYMIGKESKQLHRTIESYLNSHKVKEETIYQLVNDNDFKKMLSDLELQHTQKVSAFKVGVLCVTSRQKDFKEILSNQPPPESKFWQFLELIGKRIHLNNWSHYRGDFGRDEDQEAYYTKWKDIEIMFHIAPLLNQEQLRRLIGNDICFIVYYDNIHNEPFDPEPLDLLGQVPQIFSVVEPIGNSYRLGFFNRFSIKPYSPQAPPENYFFGIDPLKDFLFTKLHNGLIRAKTSPPMDRLYTVPRKEAIKELVGKTKNIKLAVGGQN